jgi:hypothetical protein
MYTKKKKLDHEASSNVDHRCSTLKALAVEYARYRIRANAILPGWIETDMTSPLFNVEKFEKNVMPRIPQGRW